MVAYIGVIVGSQWCAIIYHFHPIHLRGEGLRNLIFRRAERRGEGMFPKANNCFLTEVREMGYNKTIGIF